MECHPVWTGQLVDQRRGRRLEAEPGSPDLPSGLCIVTGLRDLLWSLLIVTLSQDASVQRAPVRALRKVRTRLLVRVDTHAQVWQ